MTNPSERYEKLIRATLETALTNRTVNTSDNSVDVALPFVHAVIGSPFRIKSKPNICDKPLDGAGHSRSLYRGLVAYSLAQLDDIDSSLVDSSTADSFSQAIQNQFADVVDGLSEHDASQGSRWVQLAFDALAITCAKRVNTDARVRANSILEQFARAIQTDGSFFVRAASDNPEPTWYHELAMLHAIMTFGCRTGNAPALNAARAAAQYQAEQIQPDHASSHPFALHAFLRIEHGRYLADMMLHAAGVQQPSGMDSISLLLLADALDCMKRPVWRE